MPQINGQAFQDSTTYQHTMTIGTVNQLDLTGVNAHPFHLHVNSFQLATTPADTSNGYFAAGDWHDVLMFNNNAQSVRLQTDSFTGKQVYHCHILEHEDEVPASGRTTCSAVAPHPAPLTCADDHCLW